MDLFSTVPNTLSSVTMNVIWGVLIVFVAVIVIYIIRLVFKSPRQTQLIQPTQFNGQNEHQINLQEPLNEQEPPNAEIPINWITIFKVIKTIILNSIAVCVIVYIFSLIRWYEMKPNLLVFNTFIVTVCETLKYVFYDIIAPVMITRCIYDLNWQLERIVAYLIVFALVAYFVLPHCGLVTFFYNDFIYFEEFFSFLATFVIIFTQLLKSQNLTYRNAKNYSFLGCIIILCILFWYFVVGNTYVVFL